MKGGDALSSELNGFIMLHRKILDWGWYKEPVTRSVFIHLLLRASFKDVCWQGTELKAGQVITGRKALSHELGYTENQIRTALKHLEKTGEITIKITSKFSIITIVNWEKYQFQTTELTGKITSKPPTDNQQPTGNPPHRNKYNNYKNYNNDDNNAERISYDMEEFERRAMELPVYHKKGE